ncbi:MAG: hypothetical protein IPJ19_12450 [Planctomycetes bacterium]|nr:hypothetical protein [Planctomycetota bacterium]
MKLLPLLGMASLAFASACQSQGPYVNKHWSERYVGPSMAYHFLGYNPEFDGNYRDFAWKKKQSINTTIKRHFFNHNPENPFQAEDKEAYAARPNNSLVPHPENYIHYEGLAMGAISLGVGSVFTPLPIDSIIGTFEPGGGQEFAAGFHQLFSPLAVMTTSFLYDAVGFDGGKKQGQSVAMIEVAPCCQDGTATVDVGK